MISAPAGGSRRIGLGLVALVQLVVFGLLYDNFLGRENITTIALNSTDVLIVSIGIAALLVGGSVDLSIGSQYALTAVVTAQVASNAPGWLAVVTALSLGLVLGLINGLLVVTLDISPLIVTLAMLALYRGLAFAICEGNPVPVDNSGFTAIGRTDVAGIPAPVLVALAAFLVGAWVLRTTVTGLRLYAIGGNREAAALVGLPVRRLVVGSFAANGLLVGLAGMLATAELGSASPNVGINLEVTVLTAVILGGVAFGGGSGRPMGVFVGVTMLGVLDAGLIFLGFADWYQQISRGSLLVLALAADQLILVVRCRRGQRSEPVGGAPPPALSVLRRGEVQTREPLLLVEKITVRYGGATALEDVDLAVRGGQVVCLLGDNGAGKSTLVKAVTGVVHPGAGRVEFQGRPLPSTPGAVRRAGLETVFQGLALFDNLSIADNIGIGLEARRRVGGILTVRDHRRARSISVERLASLGSYVPAHLPVERLSGGQRQAVAIARVLRDDVQVIVLDEPTAALGVRQSGEVLGLVRAAAKAGRGVLLVTHDVEEVFEVGDEAVVLGHGRVIARGPVCDMDRLELLRTMSGRLGADT
ncbi:MAG: ATP-binding cassette domain-containing protein [Actinomycetota bacterium]|jgi:ribose/xylose/arabinose/galactoside ABC-type transport system permease subunit/ABC-type branched-subunit amino acid transport system ATPase component|nr:ATP-binding cassette domain-containing protein [Actinomycetota bacterium]